MIITQNDYERQGNSEARRRQGRVKEAKLGVFVQFMIKNYNKIEHAVLREWVSNAHDSHRMAGQTKPVKITLPSTFSNMLVVQDFGLGMSYDELVNGFGVILESTKDEDNEGIGGYGIGGKAALALADQFTVVSNKDGLKNIVIFESDARTGFEILEVVTDQPTDEPNGVTMSVAVENPGAFEDANSVLEGWRSNELEVVNSKFTSFYDSSIEFTSGLVKSSIFESQAEDIYNYYGRYRRATGRAKVFVGPVAYDLPASAQNYLQSWIQERKYAIANAFFGSMAVTLPIGSVTFPSSREVIEDNAKNNTVISEAFKALAEELHHYVEENVMKFSSLEEAWAFRNSNLAKALSLEVNYEGRNLNVVALDELTYLIDPRVRKSNAGAETYNLNSEPTTVSFWDGRSQNSIPGVSIDRVSTIIRLSDNDNTPSIGVVRKHLRAYLDQKIVEANLQPGNSISSIKELSLNNRTVVIGECETDPLWEIAGIDVIDFEELRKFSKTSDAKGSANPRKTLTAEERREKVGEIIVKVASRKQSSTGAYYNDYGFATAKLNKALVDANSKLILIPSDDLLPTDLILLGHLFDLEFAQFAIVPRKRDRERIVTNFPEVTLFDDYLASLGKQAQAKAQARLTYLNRLRSDLLLDGHYERENFKWFVDHREAREELKSLVSDEDIRMASYVSSSLLNASGSLAGLLGVTDPYVLRANVQESPMTLYAVSYSRVDHDHRSDMLEYLNLVAPRYKEKLGKLKEASV